MSASDHGRAPESGRAVAGAALAAFGGSRRVRRHHFGARHVDVLGCEGAPAAGWTSYSTLNLHLSPNLVNGLDVRIELAGVADGDIEGFGEVMADAALMIMQNGWTAEPGGVFVDLVGEHVGGTTVPHLLWCPPSPWPSLNALAMEGMPDVHWLLAFPISEAERAFLSAHGFDALESLFDAHRTEYFDLFRASTI